MKRRARERLPKRAAGAFPSYLYKSLNELSGRTALLEKINFGHAPDHQAMFTKPLLILSDVELDEALLQRVGLPWVLTLALHRLRMDPLRDGIVGAPGDLLRNALRLGPPTWGALADDLEEIASTWVPELPKDDDHTPLHEAWSDWQKH